jgi:Domain of unknown function (DUF4307)
VSASPAPGGEQSLEDRYGAPRPGRRVGWLVAVGVLVVGFVAWVVWAALSHAAPSTGATLRSYEVLSEHRTRVQLDVHQAAGQPLVCTVTTQAPDHAVVGEKRVRLPAADVAQDIAVTVAVKTDRAATTAVVSDCH